MSKGWSIEYRLPSVDEIEEDTSFIGDVLAYMNSPQGELFLEVGEATSAMLENADVDAKERQIIWHDGEQLSISAAAQRSASHRSRVSRISARHHREERHHLA